MRKEDQWPACLETLEGIYRQADAISFTDTVKDGFEPATAYTLIPEYSRKVIEPLRSLRDNVKLAIRISNAELSNVERLNFAANHDEKTRPSTRIRLHLASDKYMNDPLTFIEDTVEKLEKRIKRTSGEKAEKLKALADALGKLGESIEAAREELTARGDKTPMGLLATRTRDFEATQGTCGLESRQKPTRGGRS